VFTVRQEIRFFKCQTNFTLQRVTATRLSATCLEWYDVLTVGTLWHTGFRDLTTVMWRLGHGKVECSSRL